METQSAAPFQPEDSVIVPGRYRCLVVKRCWQERRGNWRVYAECESGYGWYEGDAHEFEHSKGAV